MNIYIIGSGGFAKELYYLIRSSTNYRVIGFIDKDAKAETVNFKTDKIKIIDENYFLNNHKNENVAIGIGNPSVIVKIQKKFEAYNFPNIISKYSVYDKENIEFGKGNIITHGCILTTAINIGDFNIFNLNTTVGHDVKIGNCNVFNPSVNISGNCIISNNNLFGVSSVILERLFVGNNNIIGANSTLLKSIDNNSVFVGSPAKFLKFNTNI